MQRAGLEFRICSSGPDFRDLAGLNHIVGFKTKAETLLGVKKLSYFEAKPTMLWDSRRTWSYIAKSKQTHKCSHFLPKDAIIVLVVNSDF